MPAAKAASPWQFCVCVLPHTVRHSFEVGGCVALGKNTSGVVAVYE